MAVFITSLTVGFHVKVVFKPLQDDADGLVTDDKQRADILNKFFSLVGGSDNGVTPNIPLRVKSDINLESVRFDHAGVLKAIKKLKCNSASGPDGLPPLLFKHLGTCLAEPLSTMFNSFFSVHQMPSVWSKAIITPVFKNRVMSRTTGQFH